MREKAEAFARECDALRADLAKLIPGTGMDYHVCLRP